MVRLKRFLGGTFSCFAVVFLVLSISSASLALRVIRGQSLTLPSYHHYGHSAPPSGFLLFFSLLAPPILAFCFGMASLTIRRGKPSARPWAIASSILMLLLSLPFLISALFIPRHLIAGAASFLIMTGIIFSLGVAGLVAFAPRNSAKGGLAAKPIMPKMAGDGTGWWADALAWLLSVVGYILLMGWWYRWAHAEGLHSSRGLLLGPILIALLVSTALHEAGHAMAGVGLGMKLRLFIVGPFQWKVRDGKWKFNFDLKKALSAGGVTGCVPTTPEWQRMDEILMTAAGPAASLATGCFAAALALSARGEWYEQRWEFLATLATVSFIAGLVNLLPLSPDGMYSDGAQIYQLIKGGPWADLHRVQSLVASTLVTPLRPRDYDIEAIVKAEGAFTQGIRALLLRLYASSYFMDRGQFDEARESFHAAESLYDGAAPFVNAGLLTAFVYRSALLSRDAAAARRWWERMETAKPDHFGVDYWLAKSALNWIEGDLGEAKALLFKATSMASQLPQAGDYDFDRDRCRLLFDEIDREERTAREAPDSRIYATG